MSFVWPNSAMEVDKISAFFELFLGRPPSSETEANTCLYIARQFPQPRLEVVRNILEKPDFFANNRDMLSLAFDVMMRGHTFGKHHPPKANLFCVGAARCGTTTLAKLLGDHSDVYISPVKETNFFSHFSKNIANDGFEDSAYQFYFAGWKAERIIGDFSPNYIHISKAIDGIYSYNPDAKIIVSVRNPVDRAISAYLYTMNVHKCDDMYKFFSDGVADFLHEESVFPWYSAPYFLRQGLYSSDLAYIKSKFKNVMVIHFDEFNDMPELYSKTCQFIGIHPEQSLQLTSGKKINASSKPADFAPEAARGLLDEFYLSEFQSFRRLHGIELAGDGP